MYKLASILASHGQLGLMVLPSGFLWIFFKIAYVRAVGNSTFFKAIHYQTIPLS
jgi:hypothetical protein